MGPKGKFSPLFSVSLVFSPQPNSEKSYFSPYFPSFLFSPQPNILLSSHLIMPVIHLVFFVLKTKAPWMILQPFQVVCVCMWHYNLFKLFTYLSTLIGFTDACHVFITNPLNEFSLQNLFLNNFYQFQRNQITTELQREL